LLFLLPLPAFANRLLVVYQIYNNISVLKPTVYEPKYSAYLILYPNKIKNIFVKAPLGKEIIQQLTESCKFFTIQLFTSA